MFEYVELLYKKTLLRMMKMLSEKGKEDIMGYLIHDFANFGRYALRVNYSPNVLTAPRFDIRNVEWAVDTARRRFPGWKVYLMADHGTAYDLEDVVRIESVDELRKVKGGKVVICAFESDQRLIGALKEIRDIKKAVYVMPNVYYPTSRYFHRNDLAKKVLMEEEKIEKPKFDISDFENLLQAIEITREVEGDYLEIGVYQGRSAHLVMNYLDQAKINKTCYFIDTFEGFTYEEARESSDALWLGTHTETAVDEVRKYLKDFRDVHVSKCNIITDSLPYSIKQIALCNIDVDMYEAVLCAVKKVAPLMAIGGIVILEDQGHTPALGGAYLAVDEFLNSESAMDFVPIHMASGQMFLVRIHKEGN